MDNHCFHRKLQIREYMQNKDITAIYTPVFQINANAALAILKIVNDHFQAFCASGGLNESNIRELVDTSVEQISMMQVSHCIKESRNYIETIGSLLLNYKNPFAQAKTL